MRVALSATLVALALSFGMAPAIARGIEDKLVDRPYFGEIRWRLRPAIYVDGLPVMARERDIWTGAEWVQMGSDDAKRTQRGKPPIRGRRE